MSTRIKRGEMRQQGAQRYVVMRRERGRAGEARIMIVIGRLSADGTYVSPDSTRAHATVASWPLVGSVMLAPELPAGHCVAVLTDRGTR